MSKSEGQFCTFLDAVAEQNRQFVEEINDYLIQNGCKCEVKAAARGFIVSYLSSATKRTIATFVSRKTGMKLRIYPDHIAQYADFLNDLPDKVKKEIKKASVCKRLVNPEDCNSKCIKGYDFFIDNEHYQKCRFMAFMPTLSEENNPYIKSFLEKELCALNVSL